MRGGDLAHRVPGQEVRTHPPRLHQPVQRHLNREQRRLGVLRTVQQLGIFTEHHVGHGPVEPGVQVGADRVEGVRVDREGVVQLTPHTDALAALPAEEERQLPLGRRARHGAGTALGERSQAIEQPAPTGAEDHGTVVQGRTGRGGGERQVRQGELGVVDHVGAQGFGLVTQGMRIAGGDQHREDRQRVSRGHRLGRIVHGGLFDDDVGVGAAHAERGHARPARPFGLPVTGFGEQFDRARPTSRHAESGRRRGGSWASPHAAAPSPS